MSQVAKGRHDLRHPYLLRVLLYAVWPDKILRLVFDFIVVPGIRGNICDDA